MCLIVIAHRVSARFPLVLAANRDEDYDRATRDAHWWDDAPGVLGGRDVVHGGSWLAITKQARLAAVTNLRGAVQRSRSRGALVRDFVTSSDEPRAFAESLLSEADEYSGFHLLAGQAGGEIVHVTRDSWMPLASGIHAISNAPLGEHWPKTSIAVAEMEAVLQLDDAESMLEALMKFLTTPRGTHRIESEVFIASERYGTRASTVILASESEIVFAEQTFERGGVAVSGRRVFRISREPPLTLTLSPRR
ncbi:MAG: NRDE family protein [Acidobacteriota bacterium]|nr:NRDE family protein [Acidobacteriota bacterium]